MRRSHESRGRLLTGWVVAIIALGALTACQGGTDHDQGITPSQPPPVIPITAGNLTLELNHDTLIADGASLSEVKAALTDARGIARFGWPIEFTADLGDVTWLWSQPQSGGAASSELFPSSCLVRTNPRGEAKCVLRSGFTSGETLVNADAGILAFTSTPLILSPLPNEVRGVTIKFIGDSCLVPEELKQPFRHRVQVQVTRSAADPLGEGFPLKGVTVYFNSTRGLWEDSDNSFTSVVTDDAGVAEGILVLRKEDMGKTVTVVAFVNGSLPVSCSFVVGSDLGSQIQLALTVTPNTVQATDTKQHLACRATVTTPGRLEIDHREIQFDSPIGTFSEKWVDTESNGSADTTLTISEGTAASLLEGEAFSVTAIDLRTGIVASADVTVAVAEVTVTVSPSLATIPLAGSTTVDVLVAVLVNGKGEAGRAIELHTGKTGPGALEFGETDDTGGITFPVTYDPAADGFPGGSTINLQAVDLGSGSVGAATIAVATAAGP